MTNRPRLASGEKAKFVISAIDGQLDDCEIVSVNDDGTYRIKFQVYGQGQFYEKTVTRKQLVKLDAQ